MSFPFFGRQNSTPAAITYSLAGGASKTEEFDFVVVACDPRGLNISDRTSFEKKVNDSLHSHTFHTSLFSATRPKEPGAKPSDARYAVRFDPGTLEATDGGLYGFRDEVKARDETFAGSSTGTTWAVTYQLEDKPLLTRQRDDVEKKMNVKRDAAIKSNVWIDWQPENPVATKEITVDYFAHFTQESLREGMPWKVVEEQGKNKTLYIASFTCFESVLHCYLYQNMLMKRRDVQKRFPKNRDARIAVIGAGPAGLLFASQHLVAKGYRNFKIFESTDRYGGKTVTEYQPIPATPGKNVPCELGTCYLSPAYFPLYDLFEKYEVGEVVDLDRGEDSFRSIIDLEIAGDNAEEQLNGVSFGDWSGWRKIGAKDAADGQARIIRGGVLLMLYHVCAMGMDPEEPLPDRKPSVFFIIRNLLDITAWIVRNLDDIKELTEIFSISQLFKGLVGRGRMTRGADEGMMKAVKEMEEATVEFDLDINIGDIINLFSTDLFKTTFGEFMDQIGAGDLKPSMIYAYQGAYWSSLFATDPRRLKLTFAL